MDSAAERRLIVVTRDKGFGEVLRRPGHPGALILRLPSAATAREVSDRLARFFDAVDLKRLAGAVVILERDRFRRRVIP